MKPRFYILRGREIVPVRDVLEWGQLFEHADHVLAQESVNGVLISTVFLGIDHAFGEGPPVLFETMTFPLKGDGIQRRYCTYEDAMKGHAQVSASYRQMRAVLGE